MAVVYKDYIFFSKIFKNIKNDTCIYRYYYYYYYCIRVMTNQNDNLDTEIEFSLSKYFESLENKIQSILSRPEKMY